MPPWQVMVGAWIAVDAAFVAILYYGGHRRGAR